MRTLNTRRHGFTRQKTTLGLRSVGGFGAAIARVSGAFALCCAGYTHVVFTDKAFGAITVLFTFVADMKLFVTFIPGLTLGIIAALHTRKRAFQVDTERRLTTTRRARRTTNNGGVTRCAEGGFVAVITFRAAVVTG